MFKWTYKKANHEFSLRITLGNVVAVIAVFTFFAELGDDRLGVVDIIKVTLELFQLL